MLYGGRVIQPVPSWYINLQWLGGEFSSCTCHLYHSTLAYTSDHSMLIAVWLVPCLIYLILDVGQVVPGAHSHWYWLLPMVSWPLSLCQILPLCFYQRILLRNWGLPVGKAGTVIVGLGNLIAKLAFR